jgi:hypothetical protein
MATVCAGCRNKIPNKTYLTCALCKEKYDLDCANVSIQRFCNTMTATHKKEWKCQACKCKTPKQNNSDTPIRSRDHDFTEPHATSPVTNNITLRKNPTPTSNDTINSENISMLGDTLCVDNYQTAERQTALTLENLSELITLRLSENNKSLLLDLQNTIQAEIEKAINKLKQDIHQQANTMYKMNENITKDLEILHYEIENLKKEKEKLNSELYELNIKIQKEIPEKSVEKQYKSDANQRKFVLYGFNEISRESERDLHYRLVQMFQEILNVNILGYIEDTHRIGKYNNKNRPLVIELLSKRMVKYITNNSRLFYGTNISVSDYLDKSEMEKRKAMREQMFISRRNGHYAIIRNNQLYIDGKNINWVYNKTNGLSDCSNNNKHTIDVTPNHIDLPGSENANESNHPFRKSRITF